MTHKQLYDQWRADHKLKVDGEDFPDSMYGPPPVFASEAHYQKVAIGT